LKIGVFNNKNRDFLRAFFKARRFYIFDLADNLTVAQECQKYE